MRRFVIADVSPAVTVPLLLDFQLQGYGTDKGIPTILLAGSGFNSVFAIIACEFSHPHLTLKKSFAHLPDYVSHTTNSIFRCSQTA
jgi:NhaP-type Na+/H+ or K+/H+ antiporter